MILKPFDTAIDLSQLTADYFQARGIKAILIDLDDTLIPEHRGEFPIKLLPWMRDLMQQGIKIGIVSNNMQQSYCHKVLRHLKRAKLDIPMMGDALKPVPITFKRMLTILGVPASEAVMIGDGILTDALGGQLAGLRTIRAKCFPRAFYYTGPLFLIREIVICVSDIFRRVILNHRPKLYLLPDSHYRFRQRFLVVLNPKSSQTDAAKIRTMINEQASTLGLSVDFLLTNNPHKSLRHYRSRIKSGYYDCVAASGGDGTVRAVIERVYHDDPAVPIAILPTGTGNLMAKGLGVPLNVEDAIHLMIHGDAQSQSITLVNRQYVALLVVGIGLDADIMNETTSEMKKRTGILAYVISAIKIGVFKSKALFKVSVRKTEAEKAELHTHQAEGVILIHRNHYIKAFLPLDVAAEKNENTLDVCVIQAKSTADAVSIIHALFSGNYEQHSDILKHYQGTDVVVSTFPQENVQIDGDVISASTIHAQLIPDAISIITPALLSNTI